ncbi:hypothetical protein KC901_02185 [Patescibacteria group bacterium]|nr:hypothetical protein [Patescibacteria group bacterium]
MNFLIFCLTKTRYVKKHTYRLFVNAKEKYYAKKEMKEYEIDYLKTENRELFMIFEQQVQPRFSFLKIFGKTFSFSREVIKEDEHKISRLEVIGMYRKFLNKSPAVYNDLPVVFDDISKQPCEEDKDKNGYAAA